MFSDALTATVLLAVCMETVQFSAKLTESNSQTNVALLLKEEKNFTVGFGALNPILKLEGIY